MRVMLAGFLTAALLCGGGALFGQEPGLFDRLDANEDGTITKDEVSQERGKRLLDRLLETADENGDGKLSQEEFRAGLADRRREEPGGQPPRRRGDFGGDRPPGPPMPPIPVIRALDQDGNGELSSEEIENAAKSLAKLDRNEDGKLSRQELMPPGLGRFPGGPRPGFPGGERPAPRGEGRPADPPGARPEESRRGIDAEAFVRRLKEADADGDGKLSQDEAPERMKENFARIDADSDGFVDEKELRALVQRFRRDAKGARPGERGERDRPRGDRPPEEKEASDGDQDKAGE